MVADSLPNRPPQWERIIMFHCSLHDSVNHPTQSFTFPVEAARILRGEHRIIHAARQGVAWTFYDRRMNVLARELGCLGHYDVDPDEPNAA